MEKKNHCSLVGDRSQIISGLWDWQLREKRGRSELTRAPVEETEDVRFGGFNGERFFDIKGTIHCVPMRKTAIRRFHLPSRKTTRVKTCRLLLCAALVFSVALTSGMDIKVCARKYRACINLSRLIERRRKIIQLRNKSSPQKSCNGIPLYFLSISLLFV